MTFSYKTGLAVVLVAVATLSSLAVRMQVDDQPMEVEVASRAEQKKPKGNASATKHKKITKQCQKVPWEKTPFESVEPKTKCPVCWGEKEGYATEFGSAGDESKCRDLCATSDCCGYKYMKIQDSEKWECVHLVAGATDFMKMGFDSPYPWSDFRKWKMYNKTTKACRKMPEFTISGTDKACPVCDGEKEDDYVHTMGNNDEEVCQEECALSAACCGYKYIEINGDVFNGRWDCIFLVPTKAAPTITTANGNKAKDSKAK